VLAWLAEGSIECAVDEVLPSTACQITIAYIFLKVFKGEDDEMKWNGRNGIVVKIRKLLGLAIHMRVVPTTL
jgi:hypothetical protein